MNYKDMSKEEKQALLEKLKELESHLDEKENQFETEKRNLLGTNHSKKIEELDNLLAKIDTLYDQLELFSDLVTAYERANNVVNSKDVFLEDDYKELIETLEHLGVTEIFEAKDSFSPEKIDELEKANGDELISKVKKIRDDIAPQIDLLVLDIKRNYRNLDRRIWLNDNKKKLAYIAVALAAVVAISVVLGSCNKKNTKNNEPTYVVDELNSDNSKELENIVIETPEVTSIPTSTPTPTVEPTLQPVEEQAVFNPAYTNDYEEIQKIFNLTNNKAIDYVNRAHHIKDANFFNDADIDDIVEVLISMDDKKLFTVNNANLAQLFSTPFNRIVDNYLFGTITQDDLNKLEALKYVAKNDSDMGRFLTRFSELVKAVLANKDDNKARNELQSFIKIFATSLNGFTNDKSALTSDQDFNENAQLDDYFNYYIAHESFIGPLSDILLFPPELQEVDLYFVERIYYDTLELEDNSEEAKVTQIADRKALIAAYGFEEYEDAIFRLYEVYDLQKLMSSAIENEVTPILCGECPNLGGDN